MSTSKQKRLAREYAERHGMKYTDALRAISENPTRIPLWDGEQAEGVLTYRLGSDLDVGGPYDLHLGGGSPHVLVTGQSGSGGELIWETIAAQALTKPMPWDPTLTGGIMLIDPKGHNARRWEGRKGVEAINGLGALVGMERFRLLTDGHSEAVWVADPSTGEQEDALSGAQRMIAALDRALDECQRRRDILAMNGVSHWLDLPSPVLAEERLAPLIVILPAFASHEESVLAGVQNRATQLARVGRVAGIHLIMVSNMVTAAIIPHALRGSLATRVVTGRVPTIVDRIMFGEIEVEPGEDRADGPACFTRIMNSIGTYDSTPHRVQVAGVHEETLNKRLPRTNGNNAGNGTNSTNRGG